MKTVLVISFSDLASDPRVDRQVAALRTAYNVIAAGTGPTVYEDVTHVDITPSRRTFVGRVGGLTRLLLHRHEAVYWRFPAHLAALERLSGIAADVVLANDLYALPLALRLGKPVIFDAHEYSPEEEGQRRWWRIVIRPYVRFLCRRYIPDVAAMTTVAPTIAEEYEREFGVRAAVVTNAPPLADLEPSPVHEPIRIIHHGAAVMGRGLEEMLRLADLLDDRFVLDFMLVEGTPGLRDKLIGIARDNPRVHFPPPRRMREVVPFANSYDLGLYSLAPLNFNHRYALPNKFFEFVQARLGVVIGPSPEMASLVDRYECGVVAEDFSAESLASALNALEPETIAAFKRASHTAAAELCAERNVGHLLDAVEAALGA